MARGSRSGDGTAQQPPSLHALKTAGALVLNVTATCAIVFANKAVFSVYNFEFIYALTLIHSVTTALGMVAFAAFGFFQIKKLPASQTIPLALSFSGYVVLWQYSLRLNSVGFYQLSKVLITPAVVILEMFVSKKYPSLAESGTFLITCFGVAIATVSDPNLGANVVGIIISAAAVCFSALYQVWAGSKQKQLQVGSMQLMHQYTPYAALMMSVLTVTCEPLGVNNPTPETLLGFNYSTAAVATIAASALLALLVSLSTFLTIGATSAVTFNVVGHVKTFFIMAGGVFLFGEAMPWRKLGGIGLAMVGIIAYSYLKLTAAKAHTQHKTAAGSVQQPLLTPAGSAGISMLLDLPDMNDKNAQQKLSPEKTISLRSSGSFV